MANCEGCDYCTGLAYEESVADQWRRSSGARASVEKLCRHPVGRRRGWWKRQAHRLMRRLGQALLDDAPRRLPTRGWSD